jgi:4-amino-4-deoxy-L-arabinose transferase-like glycosyltransferase
MGQCGSDLYPPPKQFLAPFCIASMICPSPNLSYPRSKLYTPLMLIRRLVLALIILVATLVRFWELGSNPPSLYWDEVALGYNAYAISTTGQDEFGQSFPVTFFRSYGDFKPPLYIYATVPFVHFFGLHPWSVRAPSALFGVIAVFSTYFLVQQLFTFTRHTSSRLFSLGIDQAHAPFLKDAISLLAAALFALTPWHVQISRVAYEANLAQSLTVLAVLAFMLFVNRATKSLVAPPPRKSAPLWHFQPIPTLYLSASAILFALTFYTFNANRVFSVLIVLALAILFCKSLFRQLPAVLIATLIGVATVSPLIPHFLSSEGQLRFREVNIFSADTPVQLANQRIERLGDSFLANLFHNRRIYYAQSFLDGYFTHFSADFLFVRGDVNPRFSLGDVGQLYLATLPFLLIGIYFAWRLHSSHFYLILLWLLLAPLPAAVAREVPHALRTLHILPTFQILTALGLVITLYQLRSSKLQYYGLLVTFLILYLGQVLYFQYNYYRYFPTYTHEEWQYGYQQMVQHLITIQDQYDYIYITNSKGRAYLNVAFYQQYPPQELAATRTDAVNDYGAITVTAFDKYRFGRIDRKDIFGATSRFDKILLVGSPSELDPHSYRTIHTTLDLDGQPTFVFQEL